MTIAVRPARLDDVIALRDEYRREMDAQIVHDSWHARGFTDLYLLQANGETVGYGAVGAPPGEPRTMVKEFFVRRPHRGAALPLFHGLVAASGAETVAAQTNDHLLMLMAFDCATELASDTILFADAVTTALPCPAHTTLRQLSDADRGRLFPHRVEPAGDWGLEREGCIVATGGLFFHYNPPYGDIYMEVDEPHRQRGLGSYLVQELKRICREGGHVPAARCAVRNTASRRTLERAGLFLCARIVRGRIVGPA
jgi:GNAT superfamily N-acetyltransferase